MIFSSAGRLLRGVQQVSPRATTELSAASPSTAAHFRFRGGGGAGTDDETGGQFQGHRDGRGGTPSGAFEQQPGRGLALAVGGLVHRRAEAGRAALTALLGKLGEGVEVRPPLRVDYGSQITIGAGTFINFGAVLLDVAPITIGADVQIGPNVQLLTPTHPVEAEPRRAKWEAARPITIGDNVWFGGGVIVCPGVTIGENTVVGAGAVVTKDLPADVVAVGNPARVVREIRAGQESARDSPAT